MRVSSVFDRMKVHCRTWWLAILVSLGVHAAVIATLVAPAPQVAPARSAFAARPATVLVPNPVTDAASTSRSTETQPSEASATPSESVAVPTSSNSAYSAGSEQNQTDASVSEAWATAPEADAPRPQSGRSQSHRTAKSQTAASHGANGVSPDAPVPEPAQAQEVATAPAISPDEASQRLDQSRPIRKARPRAPVESQLMPDRIYLPPGVPPPEGYVPVPPGDASPE
jgi:hypothetical protein